jgi:hypothetical protein
MNEIERGQFKDLVDKQNIHEVLMRCCRGVDRVDRDLIASSYHPDGRCEFGSLLLEGGDAIADAISKASAGCLLTYHMIGSELVEVHGNVAASESHFLGSSVVAGEVEGSRQLRIRAGRYLDRLEKRDGSWKIKERTVVEDWNKGFDISDTAPAYRPGEQGRKDFLYTLLASVQD